MYEIIVLVLAFCLVFTKLKAKSDTTNLFGYKLGQSTENHKALLFFSGKETI